MICNVEINDKNLKEALYTLFGQTALDDLIKETISQDFEYISNNKYKDNTGVFVDLDDSKTNPYNLQIVEDKLFIPAKYLDIFPISEFKDKKEVEILAKIPEDFKDRFYIEYKELEDRCNKLSAMLEKWRNNSLDFTPSCSYELLEKQLQVMLEYKKILEERAKIEKISLE